MLPVILLVDDEEDILDFLERILKTAYAVLKADSASRALDILDKQVVQLIISDVMMPNMDGFELCKIIKSRKETAHIPVILLTAKNTLQAKIRGLEMDADAYIEKPFAKEHLLAQIASLIVNREKIHNYLSGSPLQHIKSMTHSKADEQFLKLLNDVICRNMEDEQLDVEKLARILNMSRATLFRKIKAVSNLTPIELINITRLTKAAELLAGSGYKIYEVALLTGFSSQSNFARRFHKQFNMTPTEFVLGKKEGNSNR